MFEVEEASQSVFGLVGGQDPVGVDGVDQLCGHLVEIVVAELGGLFDEQHLAGLHGCRVAVLDLAQGGVDQGDLFGGDQTIALRG